MTAFRFSKIIYIILFSTVCLIPLNSWCSPINKIDSLKEQIIRAKDDSNKVKTLINLAAEYSLFSPAQNIEISSQAYELSQKIHYIKGELDALGYLGDAYNRMGNFNKAMELYLLELNIAEKNKSPRYLALSLMYIGILHSEQKDYKKALSYYFQCDSLIRLYNIKGMDIYIQQDLGDAYDRINNIDSASYYYTRAMKGANEINDPYQIGAAYIGLGNCDVKNKNNRAALSNYFKALEYLQRAKEVDLYCETLFEIANVFDNESKPDSVLHYARIMYNIARQGNFETRLIEATTLLANFYRNAGNNDSAFMYLQTLTVLKDSMSSREKIRDFQTKTINEEIRQKEIIAQNKKDEEIRFQRLQLLLIGISIPVIFLITLILSRRKIHIKVIQVLGIVSILILFEYLTLLLQPFVSRISNDAPVVELLIFVCIAAILIPGHHKIEHWLIHKLTHPRKSDHSLEIKKVAIKMKRPSE